MITEWEYQKEVAFKGERLITVVELCEFFTAILCWKVQSIYRVCSILTPLAFSVVPMVCIKC